MAESKGVLARGEHQERTTSITSISAEEAPAFDHAMNNNVEAKIKNPLQGVPKEILLRNTESFARDNGLESETQLLQRGALVAQAQDFEQLDLPEEEKEALRFELAHKWRHPALLYITVLICSIGAAVQGWDQTGSNGANLSFPQDFGIAAGFRPAGPDNPNHERDGWLVGLINAAPYIASAFVGCWISDPLNNFAGRRGAICVSAVILIVTPIESGLTQTWEELLFCRLLMGLGMGLKASTVPVFAAENAPASIRGALVTTWSMWTAFGIFLGFCANLAVANVGAIAWRLQLGSAFIPAVPLAIGVWFCPESPRWYIKKSRYADAYRSLLKLRRHKILAARDLILIDAQIGVERAIIGRSTYVKRVTEIFTLPRLRRATIAAFVVNIAQQMCGINIMAFYSSTIFVEANVSPHVALIVSLGFGLVNFLANWPAFFLIDKFGRRSLLMFTFPQMAWTLLAAAFSFYIPASSDARLGLIAFFIFLFAVFYSAGEGPVPFVYTAEAFPLSHREVGMGFGIAVNLFFAAVLSITFPSMLAALTPTGAIGFYAGLNVCAFIMIFFLVPETKQLTLEELDYTFAVPLHRFVAYQTGTWLPWWCKRYILCNRRAKLPELYHMDFNGNVADSMREKSSAV